MTTPTPDDQLRPGQTWLDGRGDEWRVGTANPSSSELIGTTNVSFQRRTGGACYCYRPLTPPPSWSRLS